MRVASAGDVTTDDDDGGGGGGGGGRDMVEVIFFLCLEADLYGWTQNREG